jgi:hypothetical protein
MSDTIETIKNFTGSVEEIKIIKKNLRKIKKYVNEEEEKFVAEILDTKNVKKIKNNKQLIKLIDKYSVFETTIKINNCRSINITTLLNGITLKDKFLIYHSCAGDCYEEPNIYLTDDINDFIDQISEFCEFGYVIKSYHQYDDPFGYDFYGMHPWLDTYRIYGINTCQKKILQKKIKSMIELDQQ